MDKSHRWHDDRDGEQICQASIRLRIVASLFPVYFIEWVSSFFVRFGAVPCVVNVSWKGTEAKRVSYSVGVQNFQMLS